jgi:hypothetical protein
MKEKLKNNEKPYGLLNDEEREVLNEVGKKNCEIYMGYAGWHNTGSKGVGFCYSFAYRIKK